MKMFAFLEPFFWALSDGKLIRLAIAWVLRVLAGLLALTALLLSIGVIVFGFKASDIGSMGRSAGLVIGCLLFAIFGLVWGTLAAGIHTFRARSIEELEDSHFTVLPILSILFRLAGEMAFITYSLLAVSGCLFVWFTNISPFSALGMFRGMGELAESIPFARLDTVGFIGGIELAITFLLMAFAGIVSFYALAELSVVFVEIAQNTQRSHAVPTDGNAQMTTAAAGIPAPRPAKEAASNLSVPIATHGSTLLTCKECGHRLDSGSTFCGECGTKVD